MLLFIQFLANHMAGLFQRRAMILFFKFLANHVVGWFVGYDIIGPFSSQSYCRIVPMLLYYWLIF